MARFISKGADRNISRLVRESLKQDVPAELKKHFDDLLNKQRDADGDALPKKKDNTVKQYQKKGYNTTKWFTRTGKSTELDIRTNMNGLRISPKGKDVLKYVPKASEWFAISDELINKVLQRIKQRLK